MGIRHGRNNRPHLDKADDTGGQKGTPEKETRDGTGARVSVQGTACVRNRHPGEGDKHDQPPQGDQTTSDDKRATLRKSTQQTA